LSIRETGTYCRKSGKVAKHVYVYILIIRRYQSLEVIIGLNF
jgi:hypothetical protein